MSNFYCLPGKAGGSPNGLGQVILTALLSIPLLGEPLSLQQIFGGLVVLAGIYLANQGKGKKPQAS